MLLFGLFPVDCACVDGSRGDALLHATSRPLPTLGWFEVGVDWLLIVLRADRAGAVGEVLTTTRLETYPQPRQFDAGC